MAYAALLLAVLVSLVALLGATVKAARAARVAKSVCAQAAAQSPDIYQKTRDAHMATTGRRPVDIDTGMFATLRSEIGQNGT